MKSCVLIVRTRPVPGREAAFNRWYDEEHLPAVLKVRGFTSARRYRIAYPGTDGPWEYLAIYEFEADNPDDAMSALKARAGTPDMVLSDTMDFSNYSVVPWVAVADWQAAAAHDPGCQS